MRTYDKILTVLAALLLQVGCDGAKKGAADEAPAAADADAKTGTDDKTDAETSSPAPNADADADADADAEADAKSGEIGFEIDGEAKSFTFVTPGKNMSMSSGTLIDLRPGPDATEAFSITVMNFDAKRAELPATLELDMKKIMQGGDPSAAAKAPKPIVQYTAPDGTPYRAYAKVTFDAYDGGILSGKVEDIQLPTIKPADKDKAPVALASLSFSIPM